MGGAGGDFDVVRPRRDFTCIITCCCLLSLLLLLPLLLWLLSGVGTTLPFDCDVGFTQWESVWSTTQQEFCCSTMGRGCTTRAATALPQVPPTIPVTPFPMPPPTPPPTPPHTLPPTHPVPSGPVDPFNCAVDNENTWAADKKVWCCRVHHLGCPPTAPPPRPIMPAPQPIIMPAPQPAAPADPYNCADGFANWQAGWSVPKKEWCCRVHGKGCPNQGGGCVTSSKPYDCNAG